MNEGISSKLGVTIMKRSTRILLSAVLDSYVISSRGGTAWAEPTNLAPTDTEIVAGVNAKSNTSVSGQHVSIAIGQNAAATIGNGN